MTIHLEFTPELISEIRYQRYNHLVPLVQRRMETLLLKAYTACNASPSVIICAQVVGTASPYFFNRTALYRARTRRSPAGWHTRPHYR